MGLPWGRGGSVGFHCVDVRAGAANSGWQQMGNWTTTTATVSAVSVTPNSGSGTWSSQTIGTAGVLQNSQCTVDVGGSTAIPSGNNLTLSVPITFQAGFAGDRQTW